MSTGTVILSTLFFFLLILFRKTIHVVPQRSACIVERLGKYNKTLEAGFYILVPFIDRIAYRHTLKRKQAEPLHTHQLNNLIITT